ncbi:MAG TPA: protein kinase [Vicinamibacterales bacterium]|nr:protein kinase [Vicinamibacterales bacterium]
MGLSAGTRIGPYDIAGKLGAGGMGEVYRARDTRLDRDVAIKVVTAGVAGDAATGARLTREARAVAAISHPNVLAVFDVGEHDGQPFVVTELLEGTTLRTHMSAGALDVPVAVRHAVQVANGLAAAHDKGIVHRDLKPENVFITADRRVKILDFGLARQAVAVAAGLAETQLGSDTTPGLVLGTAGYMSPEQARGLAVDHRSDIFSFGAMLFEMLAGRRAFRGETMADTMASVVRDAPADLQQLNSAVSPALARVVSRCLAKGPGDRFRSAHDLSLALEAISGAGSGVASGTAAPAPRADRGVVVLPFENMSADADNEFFADGLTEEIISDLSKIHELRVISRTSAMQLKGRKGSLPALVSELNVQYVLEGSVRRAGDRLRITAQLIDVLTDAHLWSEKYHGTIEDVFDIQERVARSIADALRLKLTPEESRAIASRPIADPAAFECFLRARAALRAFDEPSLHRAVREIETGLAREPESPLLLALKGDAAWQLFNIGLAPAGAQLAEVRDIAARIERADPGSHHAQRLLGLLAAYEGRMGEAASRLRRAAEMDVSDTFAASLAVFGLAMVGRIDEAEALHARVRLIDPLDPLIVAGHMWVVMMAGRFEEAARIGATDYDRWSDHPAFVTLYVQVLASAGRVSEAVRVAGILEQARPADRWTWFAQIFKWALEDDPDRIAASITPERDEWVRADVQYSHMIAQCFAMTGRPDEAFAWLEVMVSLGAAPYPFLHERDPLIARLRTDARWPAFIGRVKRVWEEQTR